MCKDCVSTVQEVLAERDTFQLSNRRRIVVDRVEGDDVYLEGGRKPAMHVSHVAEVLHWLQDGHFVCGISSGTTAIKTLLSGKLVDCSTCAGHASQVWSVLVVCPGVARDGKSGLAPGAASR